MSLLVIIAVASDRETSPAYPADVRLIPRVDSHVRNNCRLLIGKEAAAFAPVARTLAVEADRCIEVYRINV